MNYALAKRDKKNNKEFQQKKIGVKRKLIKHLSIVLESGHNVKWPNQEKERKGWRTVQRLFV